MLLHWRGIKINYPKSLKVELTKVLASESYVWDAEPPKVPPWDAPPGFNFEPEARKTTRRDREEEVSALSQGTSRAAVQKQPDEVPVYSDPSPSPLLARDGTRANTIRVDGTKVSDPQILLIKKNRLCILEPMDNLRTKKMTLE